MKTKKKKRAFAATDTLWKLVEEAAKDAGISINEWITSAVNQQLKEGIHGSGVDLESVSELATAQAITEYSNSIERQAGVIERAIARTDKIFEDQRKKLDMKLAAAKNKNKNLKDKTE